MADGGRTAAGRSVGGGGDTELEMADGGRTAAGSGESARTVVNGVVA